MQLPQEGFATLVRVTVLQRSKALHSFDFPVHASWLLHVGLHVPVPSAMAVHQQLLAVQLAQSAFAEQPVVPTMIPLLPEIGVEVPPEVPPEEVPPNEMQALLLQ
jgi:hypothetical protein